MPDPFSQAVRAAYLPDEAETVLRLAGETGLDGAARQRVVDVAGGLVADLRGGGGVGLMETFLAEYGLSSMEGVALMCLAEALLRVPDEITIDALIRDKIAPADWARHMGGSDSLLVNASTWALMLTGKVIGGGESGAWDIRENLLSLLRRAGEPVIRSGVTQAMKVLGHQFVLGRDIAEAMARAQAMIDRGYTYSYDMLGEAARTANDARRYFMSYSQAIAAISGQCGSDLVHRNSGISVKLSALHPRYEFTQKDRLMGELAPRVGALALIARNAGMGFNIDAEEADRLDPSLAIIETVLASPDLKGWDGFGVVVQAYMARAPFVIDWLYDLARRLDRRISIRLVKGAYWDSEIKNAQVEGLPGYPVFTRKASTDICYMACARRLLAMTDRIYPQFASHNAHTMAAVLEMSGDGSGSFEFQRLHGMGEALHDMVRQRTGHRCRIYAPVGNHRDLLAYLVRRLLENGANSSFVNQLLDPDIPPERVARDPLAMMENWPTIGNPGIPLPGDLYGPARKNSRGVNLADPLVLAATDAARGRYRRATWTATAGGERVETVCNPTDPGDIVGTVNPADAGLAGRALARAAAAAADWRRVSPDERADCLLGIADLLETHAAEFYALVCREAGKTLPDAIGEVREAVDFCRYYAGRTRTMPGGSGRGVFVCISPWNFPLAIFTGQVVAALVTGNAVIAKPAEQTPLTAARAVALMHRAGIPENVLQLLPGDGATVGAALVGDRRVDGVCFTGSTETAAIINRAMAAGGQPAAPLIAETGGLNAMIVDSTALPEQAVDDILASAFQSAGQRCSALRVLFVQEELADALIEMLAGAMAELKLGDPWEISTDIGPVIDEAARSEINRHCAALETAGRLIAKVEIPEECSAGTFVAPAAYSLDSLDQLDREIFGPVLHVVRYPSGGLDTVIGQINASGYGLTLGLHTRLDHRVHQVAGRVRVGNCYVNRNQIGAVVGVQPFGGEGLSGTGPKAGGPHYLGRFVTDDPALPAVVSGPPCDNRELALAIDRAARAGVLESQSVRLSGPTGESNILSLYGRGVVLCLGRPDLAELALAAGNGVVLCGGDRPAVEGSARMQRVAGLPRPETLTGLDHIAAVAGGGGIDHLRAIRMALAARPGPIVPLLTGPADAAMLVSERTLSINTTASGGNTALLAAAGE